MAPRITCDCGTCAKCKRREYMKRWYRSPGQAERARARALRYRAANLERVQEYDRSRGYRGSAEMTAAHNAVRHALERGEIERQPCQDCGREPAVSGDRQYVEAHHEDYSKPLAVTWLCRACHRARHRKVA